MSRSRAALRGATISDVAERAGVSVATVSRVMNGLPTVAPEIAGRVQDAVAHLGYSPSGAARSLSLGVSRTVAVVVPDLGNPMFQQILHAFHRAAAADGYHLLVTDTQETSALEGALAQDARARTDAILLCAPRMPHSELIDLVSRIGPVVIINRELVPGAASIAVDYESGIVALGLHLYQLGHRRFGYLAGPEGSQSNMVRERGLAELEARYADIAVTRIPCGSGLADGYASLDAVMSAGVTAVLAFNDVVALGLLGRLDEEGCRAPATLSVTGFDDIEFARFSNPGLTTMRIARDAIGAAAWQAMHAGLTGAPPPPASVLLPELVIRHSTGAPR